MVDLSVFRNRRFCGGSLAVTAAFLAIFGFLFVIIQYFQFLKNYSPLETGVRLLPDAVSLAIAGVFAPRLVERVGTTAVVVLGLVLLAAGMSYGTIIDASTPYVGMAIAMVLIGSGTGLTSAPATEAIMGSLSADKAGVGSAVNESTRELGAAVGTAITGSVFASVYTHRLADQPVIASLPAAARSAIGDSIAAAHRVAEQLPPVVGQQVRLVVDNAFLDGMSVGSLVCVAVALVAAAIVAVLLPARAVEKEVAVDATTHRTDDNAGEARQLP
jgi:predicted MFS family arabinose efflux permease